MPKHQQTLEKGRQTEAKNNRQTDRRTDLRNNLHRHKVIYSYVSWIEAKEYVKLCLSFVFL